ncbi:LOW QUALITY PROTEIN: hypothetical protein ColTof4_01330 [Colletotrichum tofieldiae]|nr:LOW QUALITY PROTEIN: hypothetical protein ColTof3_08583 [Colletotrichum tofieldiae]GKT68907.1 LOW QUALITY PROTEIN: hypothetical protein ColTof4_01330 [Colletotrichum tofieldiae]
MAESDVDDAASPATTSPAARSTQSPVALSSPRSTAPGPLPTKPTTPSLVIDTLVDGCAAHLRSLRDVPENDGVSNYFKDFQLPANVKSRFASGGPRKMAI